MESFEIAQIVTAGASATIALAALWLSIFEGRQNRKHLRLSLKPELVLDTAKKDHPTIASAAFINAGLGPARIIKMRVFVSGEEVNGDLSVALKSAVTEKVKRLKTKKLITTAINPGYVLRASNEIRFLYIELDRSEACTPDELEGLLEGIDIGIEFESFYGEKDSFDSRNNASG